MRPRFAPCWSAETLRAREMTLREEESVFLAQVACAARGACDHSRGARR